MKKKHEKRILNNFLITNSQQYFVPAYWLTQIDEQFEGDEMVQVNIVENKKLFKKFFYFNKVKYKPSLQATQRANLYEDLYDICINFNTYNKINELGDYTGELEGSELEKLESELVKVRWWGR